jgi:aryl-phospho-beta-D-glucosidase BglC (GH1 family)
MNKFNGFKAGVNLGGWISQYHQANKEHFDSFITEADIARIAGWGMDHVRLPMDSKIRWHNDLSDLLMEYGIGRAVWTYKLMSFPMVDENSDIINKELIEIVSRKYT